MLPLAAAIEMKCTLDDSHQRPIRDHAVDIGDPFHDPDHYLRRFGYTADNSGPTRLTNNPVMNQWSSWTPVRSQPPDSPGICVAVSVADSLAQ
jgi:hypothetical protein